MESPIDFKYFGGWTSRYSSIAMSWFKSRFISRTPFVFSHSVTHGCNSRCKTCGIWHFSHLMKNDLTTKQVFKLLKEAADMGMRGYYAWGGEPMIRKDIGEILKYARDVGMLTVLNTNGTSLAQRAKELSRFIDFCYISIDAPDKQHDFIRGRKGSFKEATEAVKQMVKVGESKTTIVSVASKLNLQRMEEMCKFAVKLGVGIEFNTVDPSPTDPYQKTALSPKESYALNPKELHYFYMRCLELKRMDYPVMDVPKILEEHMANLPFTCHFPKIFCYISADGHFVPCTYEAGLTEPVNLLKTSMKDFFNSEEYREHAKLSEQCHKCLRPCVRLYSYAYDFYKPAKLKALSSIIKQWKISKNQRLFEGVFKPTKTNN